MRRALLLWDVDSGSAMMTFQCDSGDNRHKVNVMEKTLQVVEQLWQQVVEQFTLQASSDPIANHHLFVLVLSAD
ncbi:hypothetical protein ACWICO_15870 [Glutamicibacter sp. NPDC055491]